MAKQSWSGKTERIDSSRLRLPKSNKSCMRVDGLIFCDENLEKKLISDNAPEQVCNVACLPGIVGNSMAMPDIHWGYGFPIGGVAGFSESDGIISPGGVGYDINCGVRLIRTNLTASDFRGKIKHIVFELFRNIPAGVGSSGRYNADKGELSEILTKGAKWAIKKGFGFRDDFHHIEEGGAMEGADISAVSERAFKRGAGQVGTLGAGNHFVELQEVSETYDAEIADTFGLFPGQLVVLIHTGSRGFGHQVATDYIEVMQKAVKKYNIELPDRQLACAPFSSTEGKKYFGAMVAAANYAWANRQLITHWVRESLVNILGVGITKIGGEIVYDVAHNIAKREIHDGKKLIIHRKGATRAFPAGWNDLPDDYKDTGHPVLVPGDMGRYSYVMVGTKEGAKETFASCCHGAGRMLSRTAAKKRFTAGELYDQLEKKGITAKAKSNSTFVEEAPGAYKDVAEVVGVLHKAGIAKKVAKMKPLGVIKG
jgi:tRNA-splicing ligase RtcB (3'-phosphate/5'-hydroxy nucleic acid ligase)